MDFCIVLSRSVVNEEKFSYEIFTNSAYFDIIQTDISVPNSISSWVIFLRLDI